MNVKRLIFLSLNTFAKNFGQCISYYHLRLFIKKKHETLFNNIIANKVDTYMNIKYLLFTQQ
jgi:hypothetical protein